MKFHASRFVLRVIRSTRYNFRRNQFIKQESKEYRDFDLSKINRAFNCVVTDMLRCVACVRVKCDRLKSVCVCVYVCAGSQTKSTI